MSESRLAGALAAAGRALPRSPVDARAAVTIRRPPDEVRERWREARPLAELEADAEVEVEFRPAPRDQGTEIHARLRFSAPGGSAGVAVAKLTGEEPLQRLKDELRRFKQVLETGEVVRSDGTPEGHAAARHLAQRPARPLEEAAR